MVFKPLKFLDCSFGSHFIHLSTLTNIDGAYYPVAAGNGIVLLRRGHAKMERLFALDLSMRSTACNYDPCMRRLAESPDLPHTICKEER